MITRFEREPGFYWVIKLLRRDWEVGYWNGEAWGLAFSNAPEYQDRHFADIDERRIERLPE